MKFEFSAGGIVFKNQNDNLHILVAKHSYHKGWVFPKGLIDREKKESRQDAAIREVEEETGAKGEILKELPPSTFFYSWDGEKRKKTVYYFIMRFIGGDITKHDTEMEEVVWVTADKVLETLTHKGEKQVFKKALPEIEKLSKS